MPVFLFYVTANPTNVPRQRIMLPDGREAYIRIVQSESSVDMDALDECELRDDEQFMNTHEL